ncbi:unnamed protein product [Ranitomeya imitator]|uniref:Peptidase M13 N-terminal domain-containing protein n=1 Tax=Ranitomeya imitator TaxID=111125 RepID=A0ABN9L1K2_9NEOB|nr:unnamed protein product [Ranitomeya imitator]
MNSLFLAPVQFCFVLPPFSLQSATQINQTEEIMEKIQPSDHYVVRMLRNPDVPQQDSLMDKGDEEGKYRVTKSGPALSNPMFTLITRVLQGDFSIVEDNFNDAEVVPLIIGLIEQRDSLPLLELLTLVGEWPVAYTDWNLTKESSWSLEEKLSLLNQRFNKRVLIDLFVWNDDRESSKHIIYIDQPSLGMPSRDYYFNSGNYQRIREAYLQFMVTIAKMVREDKNLTKDDNYVHEEMARVMDLESDIAKATAPSEERNDVTLLYNKMTLTEFQQKFSTDEFNWTIFIQEVMTSVSIKLHPEEEVVVYGVPYLQTA